MTTVDDRLSDDVPILQGFPCELGSHVQSSPAATALPISPSLDVLRDVSVSAAPAKVSATEWGRERSQPLQTNRSRARKRVCAQRRRASESPTRHEARLAKSRIRDRNRRRRLREAAAERLHPLDEAFHTVQELVVNPTVDVDTWTAPPGGVEADVKVAAKFSQYMDDHLPLHVCACCGMYRGQAEIEVVSSADARFVQQFAVLRRDGPHTPGLPRVGLTVTRVGGVDYCLAPEGVRCSDGAMTWQELDGDRHIKVAVCAAQCVAFVNVCRDNCLPHLQRQRVPRYSLVAFDAGRLPDLPHLVPLSPIEELIVAPLRVNRFTVIARPPVPTPGRSRDTFQSYLQGHVVAVPNVPLDAWKNLVMPLRPEALADFVDVVVLSYARTPEEAAQMAQRIKCAQVRPKVIVAWVLWLADVIRKKYPDLHVGVDQQALRYYQSAQDVIVPVSVQQNTHFMQSADAAEEAAQMASGIRAGYANARPDVAADQPRMPDLELDCDSDAPMVTEQVELHRINQLLKCCPCVLRVPARPKHASPDVLLPAATVVVDDWSVLLTYVIEVLTPDVSALYKQVDLHVKAVVRQYQLGRTTCKEHMSGIEELSVVVDVDAVMQAGLPDALSQIFDEHRPHRDGATNRGSGVSGVNVSEPAATGGCDNGTARVHEPERQGADVVTNLRRVLTGEDATGKIGVMAGVGSVFPDMDKRWPALTHPSVFPYCEGTPPDNMSYDAWLRVILQRAPREQFAEQPTLVLDMFNVTQRHEVNIATKRVLLSNETQFREFADMSSEQVVMAVELFQSKSKGKAYADALAQAPAVVQKFLRAMRQISAKVRATPAYYASLRSQAFALWHAVGPFTAFPTYNPSELHSPSALKVLGFEVHYAGDFGAPTDLPLMVQRWRAVAANPVACAQFFNTYRGAVWSVLYGWPRDRTGQQQLDPQCPFGRIRAAVDRAENSGRGALHPHMLVAQADLQPSNLRRLQRHRFDEVIKFARQISCKELPVGWYVEGCGDWVDTSESGAKLAVDFSRLQASKAMGVCCKFPVSDVTTELGLSGEQLVGVSQERRQLLQRYVVEFQARVAASNQLHSHSHRCQKGGRRGDDNDCAMCKPEQIRPEAEQLDGGCVLLRCDHGMIVPYCPALLLVDPCNQAIVLCWDASRWRTEQLRAEADGRQFDLSPPSLELHAAQAANYALKYITKRPQEVDNTAAQLVAACKCSRLADMAASSSESAVQKGKQWVVQVLNKLHGKIVVPQSLAALHLCGFGDHFMTHKVVSYYPTSFAAHFRQHLAPHLALHVREGKEVATAINVDGKLVFVKTVGDYIYRHKALQQLPAYFYLMCVEGLSG